jgi:hypothetical protein
VRCVFVFPKESSKIERRCAKVFIHPFLIYSIVHILTFSFEMDPN